MLHEFLADFHFFKKRNRTLATQAKFSVGILMRYVTTQTFPMAREKKKSERFV